MDRSWTTGRIRALFALAMGYWAGLAASSTALAADVSVEKVMGNLMGPSALAVRPGSNGPSDVFIAECGAGRVVRIAGNSGNSTEVIAGFPPQAVEGKSDDKPVVVGIQSLFFLDRTRLVVAGGDVGGKPFIRLYEVGDTNFSLNVSDAKQDVELPPNDDQADSIRSFHNLIRTQPNDKVPDVLIAAARSERRPAGWWKVAVRANTLGDIARFRNVKSDNTPQVIGGTAIADSGYVVIASGTNSNSQPTTLTFINPAEGRTVFRIKTDLERIVALAYNPTTGNLFAADAPLLSNSGGIYRLDDDSKLRKPACKAVKVADVARPTELAFATDGTLYVTALGENGGTGSLLKITGEL